MGLRNLGLGALALAFGACAGQQGPSKPTTAHAGHSKPTAAEIKAYQAGKRDAQEQGPSFGHMVKEGLKERFMQGLYGVPQYNVPQYGVPYGVPGLDIFTGGRDGYARPGHHGAPVMIDPRTGVQIVIPGFRPR